MKKIVSILAVAAVATSMFAVDVAGRVKFTGSLFDFNTDSNKVEAIKLDNGNTGFMPWDQTGISFSGNTDNAGATITLTAFSSRIFDRASVWAKPMDNLKLTVGYQGYGINTETIDWSSIMGFDGEGYGANIAAGAVSIDVAAMTGYVAALFADNKIVKPLAVKIGTSGDWGNAAVLAKYADKDLMVSAGYSGSVDTISYFVDVVYKDAAAKEVVADAFVNYSDNGITAKAYVANTYNLTESKDYIKVKAYASYALVNGITPSIYVASDNVLGDGLGLTVKPAISGNWGAMSWDIGLKMVFDTYNKETKAVAGKYSVNEETGKVEQGKGTDAKAAYKTACAISVPVTFKVNF